MAAYTIRRALWSVPVLLLVMLLTFALMRGAGGSPFRLESGGLPYSLQVQLTEYYGLDRPWFVEFLNYVRHVLSFDFGPSLTDRYTTVDDVIERRFPVTGELSLLATLWAVPLGIVLGLLAAVRRGRALDVGTTSFATVLLVVPVFLFAEVGSDVLVHDWGLFPRGWDGWDSKILPSLVLALAPAGYIARLVRAAAVQTLQEDYVRTAQAKGLSSERILVVHVLRNSLGPFLSAAVPTLALLVTGAFFVEQAFGIPGASAEFVRAAKLRDYPMVMGLTVALTAVVLLASLVADVVAAALDPRIREGTP
jgi:oligopeptide transport system permease protein